jgi:hypothetical protein
MVYRRVQGCYLEWLFSHDWCSHNPMQCFFFFFPLAKGKKELRMEIQRRGKIEGPILSPPLYSSLSWLLNEQTPKLPILLVCGCTKHLVCLFISLMVSYKPYWLSINFLSTWSLSEFRFMSFLFF